MNIPLTCSECEQTAEYTIEQVVGKPYTVHRGKYLPAGTPDPLVVKCKRCPESFKVPKHAVEQHLVDANLYNENTTRG